MAFDKPISAITDYCEASSASPQERRCIMHTIFNRVADGRFGRSPAEVCLRRMQFSEWNGDAANNANLLRAARAADDDPIMLDCMAAFDEVKAGAADPTNGATHYHDKSIPAPYWAARATVALETGKFIFYKNVP